MTLPGNHERETSPKVTTPFLAYKARFRMPSNGEPSETNFYWSMDYSYVHIVALSTETAFDQNSPQFKWFIQDMENVNRTNTPFIIVMFHRPFYNSNLGRKKLAYYLFLSTNNFQDIQIERSAFRVLYEDYFLHYCVDAVFAGHVHACTFFKI